MSIEAVAWAFRQPMKSSAKFVLVAMANCANADWECWPSEAHLAEMTGQNRKTIVENIKRLKDFGYIQDTGRRKGRTSQVVVFKITNPARHNSPEFGTVEESQFRDTYTGGTPNNSTENGTVEESRNWDCLDDELSQNRDSLMAERVPNFPIKSPVFTVKESQIRDTEKSGTVRKVKAVAAESILFSEHAGDHRPRFSMPLDWQPTASIQKRAQIQGVNPDKITKEIIGTFASHHEGKGGESNQSEWENLLIKWIKREWPGQQLSGADVQEAARSTTATSTAMPVKDTEYWKPEPKRMMTAQEKATLNAARALLK